MLISFSNSFIYQFLCVCPHRVDRHYHFKVIWLIIFGNVRRFTCSCSKWTEKEKQTNTEWINRRFSPDAGLIWMCHRCTFFLLSVFPPVFVNVCIHMSTLHTRVCVCVELTCQAVTAGSCGVTCFIMLFLWPCINLENIHSEGKTTTKPDDEEKNNYEWRPNWFQFWFQIDHLIEILHATQMRIFYHLYLIYFIKSVLHLQEQ